jgi:hypothetical protein
LIVYDGNAASGIENEWARRRSLDRDGNEERFLGVTHERDTNRARRCGAVAVWDELKDERREQQGYEHHRRTS